MPAATLSIASLGVSHFTEIRRQDTSRHEWPHIRCLVYFAATLRRHDYIVAAAAAGYAVTRCCHTLRHVTPAIRPAALYYAIRVGLRLMLRRANTLR